jgi:hypothetical protein
MDTETDRIPCTEFTLRVQNFARFNEVANSKIQGVKGVGIA